MSENAKGQPGPDDDIDHVEEWDEDIDDLEIDDYGKRECCWCLGTGSSVNIDGSFIDCPECNGWGWN